MGSRGASPPGASAAGSTTTSVDEEWAATSSGASAAEEASGARPAGDARDGGGATDGDPSAAIARSAEGVVLDPRFKCKKCAKGSSCWPVHVVTQKLSTMRRKAGRRVVDPEEPWSEFEGLLADGHRPTFKTYTALATVLGDMGAPEDAEEVLERMREAGEEPDVRAHNVAAHAWCASDRPEEAIRVVERAREMGAAPNRSTYPEIVAAFARKGDERAIEEIISRVEVEAGGDALVWYEKIYHAYISGCCQAGKPDAAEAVLRRWNLEKYDMERVADRKGDISRPVAASYGMVIDHYVGEGMMGEARRLLSQMQWDKVAPSIDIFNMLLKGYLRGGNVGAAQDVFRELEGSGTWDMESLGIKPDVASYTSLLDHWANQGDVELSEKVLEKMTRQGVAPDERTFGALVKAYARARDPSGAERVLERMREFEVPPEKPKPGAPAKYVGPKDERKKMKPGVVLFSTVVSAYAAVGDLANAKRVVMEMSAAPKSWKAAPNERTFGHLVWGYGQMGDVAGITQTAQMMIDQGLSLRMGSEGRKSLVRACRECGLPASHVDKLVDNLTPKRRNGKGGGERWVKPKRASAAASADVGEGGVVRADVANAAEASKPPAARGARSAGRKPASSPSSPSPSRFNAGGNPGRSGDAGWACSAVGVAPARGVRVVARPSRRSRASVGLAARRSRGMVGGGRVFAAFALAARAFA